MKRAMILLCSLLTLLAFGTTTAFAAETPGSNVTITVVMPEPTLEPTPEPPKPAEIKVYPSDVTETNEVGVRQIIKTYELKAGESPADIPREDFERSGWKFILTDILRKETANAEIRDHTEMVTLNTDTKELEKILPLLDPTMEYTAEDGFVGILSLDVASIKVETAGTKTTSYEMKVTREYPHLSSNDTSLVPKTVTDNGKTYTLAGVDWKAGNTVTIDYDTQPEYYTAIATYTATGSSTKVTGYTTTAVYDGTLAKLTQGVTVYTAYFLGEEIRTPLEMTELQTEPPTVEPTAEPTTEPAEESNETPSENGESNHSNNALLVIIPILGAAAGVLYYIKKRKGQSHNEKTHNNPVVADDDNGDDRSGSGE